MTRIVSAALPVLVLALWLVSSQLLRAQERYRPSRPPAPVVPPAAADAASDRPHLSHLPPDWLRGGDWQPPLVETGIAPGTRPTRDVSEDGQFLREHVVNNPRGEMTQTWERRDGEDGYLYRHQQTWAAPDGTLRRQHERTLTGSDPYNYTREHNITLPDGRTIMHTHERTWDGTQGTMERSFFGPNGQTRQVERSWSPDGRQGQATTDARPSGTGPSSEAAAKVGWWQKLNPFHSHGGATGDADSTASLRRGFTVGRAGTGSSGVPSVRSGEHPSVRASQHTHRPSWAGGPARSILPGPPPHANGNSAVSRPGVGRGRNR